MNFKQNTFSAASLEPGTGSETNDKADSDLESETDTETDEKTEKDAEEGKLENDLPVETEKSKDELKTENISNAIQTQLLNMVEFKIPEPKADLDPLLMQDDDGSMKFSLSPFGYDVKGYSASDEIRSSLGGYGVWLLQNDQTSDLIFSDGNMESTKGDLKVFLRAKIETINDLSYVRLIYYVENTNADEAVTFSLGSAADTCVGSDDHAAVRRSDDGILMLGRDYSSDNREEYKLAFSVTNDEESDADVDRWWYGRYYDWTENIFTGELPTEELKGVDSGMAYSWIDQTLEGGQTAKYSVLFGIGSIEDYAEPEQKPEPEPEPEPIPTPTPAPSDQESSYESEDSEDHDDTEYWAVRDGKWTFTYGVSYRNQWGYLYYNGAYGWYFFNQDGFMETGWHTDQDGRKFYLNPSIDGKQGMMCTGWNLIDGKWYYFSMEDGAGMGQLLVSATTPDGYEVDENGEWIN